MLSPEVLEYIDRSVLCWLATSSPDNAPNVSPKEIFAHYGADSIIIANIASPQTVKNIEQNENVCLSFIDILVQKGFQLKGKARIIGQLNPEFEEMKKIIVKMTEGKFPFPSITCIEVQSVKPIIAPSYTLYPETTEAGQIESARKAYKL